jgi:hypothetical protein
MVVPQVIKHCLVTLVRINKMRKKPSTAKTIKRVTKVLAIKLPIVFSLRPLSWYLPPRHCPEAGAIST